MIDYKIQILITWQFQNSNLKYIKFVDSYYSIDHL